MSTYRIKGLSRALFEEAGDALFLFDPDTEQIVHVNPMAERLSGFSRGCSARASLAPITRPPLTPPPNTTAL